MGILVALVKRYIGWVYSKSDIFVGIPFMSPLFSIIDNLAMET